MIVFVPAWDPATRANAAVARHAGFPDALIGLAATREGLQERLRAAPADPLFALSHGEEGCLKAQDGARALDSEDGPDLRGRVVFAYACLTAVGLGRTMAAEGCTWWGYTRAIAAPGDSPPELPIFADLFRWIADHFAQDPERLKAELVDQVEMAAERLDAVEPPASFGSYKALLDLWSHVRQHRSHGETWRHPRAPKHPLVD